MRRGSVAVVAALALVSGGCSVGDRVRPPGVRDDQWQLSVVVDDALNLPLGAAVKSRGLVVGRVVDIEPDDYRARVELAVDDDVELGKGSRFRLRYTTALGEMYVDVEPTDDEPLLADGDVVRGPTVTTSATVEDTLASASLLVNGGGLGQLQTVVSELNTALEGRVGATRGVLTETDRFLDEALRSTREIDRVLGSLAAASRTLDDRQETIDSALRDLRPAARTLARNTDDLAGLLRRSDRLAVVADRLVRRTRADLTTVVDELGPVLEELLGIRAELVPGLDLIAGFAGRIDAAAPTDYLNLRFRLDALAALLPVDDGSPSDEPGDGPPGLPELPELPELPGLPGVPVPPDGAGAAGSSDLSWLLGLRPEEER